MFKQKPTKIKRLKSLGHLPVDDQPSFGVDGMTEEQTLAIVFHHELLIRSIHNNKSMADYLNSRKKQLDELAKLDR